MERESLFESERRHLVETGETVICAHCGSEAVVMKGGNSDGLISWKRQIQQLPSMMVRSRIQTGIVRVEDRDKLFDHKTPVLHAHDHA